MRVLLAALLLTFLPMLPTGALAEPVDLLDETPRWVDVAFEVSPRDRPAQTDTVYTSKIPARLEADEEPGRVVVTIDRSHVEDILFGDDEPVSGSFSDYVWIFDSASGEVVSASLAGILTGELDWGLFHTRTRTHIAFQLLTHRIGGVRHPRRWLGRELFEYCEDRADERCNLVAGRPYDAGTGYVYAVGPIEVGFSEVKLRTFSPLGEAIFSEREPMGGASMIARRDGSDDTPPLTAADLLASPALAPVPSVSAGPPLR